MQSLAFDAADQQRFADLSGDRNPLHVDAVAARRLLTGRAVVHGVHTLLRLLDGWPALPLPQRWRIEAEFLAPVSVGDAVQPVYGSADDGAPQALAMLAGLPACRIALREAQGAAALAPKSATVLSIGEQPLDREPASWPGERISMALPAARFDADFPAACAALGERRIAALALLSSYVGMVCPGLHSVFSSLAVEPGDAAADALQFEVRRYDPRFKLFVVAIDGALRGQLKAFVRAAAQVQPGIAELRGRVAPGEFAGGVHWVFGGSRGLGEVVAKLLAAGGARVVLSHAAGAADAQRVADEISAAGAPPARVRRLDLLHDAPFDDWLRDEPWPDAVWFFATPRIYRKRAALFDAALLDEFLLFYVRRFEALCQALEAAAGERRVSVFHPSTVFIEQRPKGMTEYTMAKAAAEVLIDDLARLLQRVRPLSRRLPRLATDQTAGIDARGTPDNADVMLALLRELLPALR